MSDWHRVGTEARFLNIDRFYMLGVSAYDHGWEIRGWQAANHGATFSVLGNYSTHEDAIAALETLVGAS